MGDDDFRHDQQHDPEVESPPRGGSRKRKGKRDPQAMRKAPHAPKRFKSSYICFFMAKQGEIKEALGDDANVSSISKRSAEMWYVCCRVCVCVCELDKSNAG